MIEQILQADRYLQVDQVDRARDVYQRVVEADPGNAIAMVGLARCALAEGEDVRAHELAARALTIDPENEMARRMEARLAEVLAVRGEAVDRPAAIDEGASAGPASPGSPADVVPASPAPTPSPTAPASPAASPPPTAVSMPPSARKESPVRKSLFDRLMGR